jgi:hypothetical protein
LTAGALPLVEPLIPPRATAGRAVARGVDDRAVFTGIV